MDRLMVEWSYGLMDRLMEYWIWNFGTGHIIWRRTLTSKDEKEESVLGLILNIYI